MTDRPPIPARPALFLDFDGTLVGFAETPDAVDVPDNLQPLLDALSARCDGAVAFVTGRSIAGLDALLVGQPPHAVGVHGAEWRLNGADVQTIGGESFDDERVKVRAFADANPAIVMEEKSAGLTLHYRRQPALEDDAVLALKSAFAGRDDFESLSGHMLTEVRRKGVHKGAGIDRLMSLAPFEGRTPVFLGDDVTDEDGFGAVNARDGVSVRIGEGDTSAKYRLPDIASVYEYLEQMVASS
ncbi:MAG: trehalose-phosphatase [Pseudomonadota bacterium]